MAEPHGNQEMTEFEKLARLVRQIIQFLIVVCLLAVVGAFMFGFMSGFNASP